MLLADVTRRVEASQGAVRHLVVLLPVPIVYPKIPASEALLAAVSSELGARGTRARGASQHAVAHMCRRCMHSDAASERALPAHPLHHTKCPPAPRL
jgi:hypothetical protein